MLKHLYMRTSTMTEHRQYQILSYLFAFALAVVTPLILLSPVWYWQLPLTQFSWHMCAVSIGSFLFGIWLAIVAFFVPSKALVNVLDAPQLGVPLLVIPYALYVGTKALLFKNNSARP